MSYLGIDIGMTGAKALVVDETGKVLKRKYTTYGSDYQKNIQIELLFCGSIWNVLKQFRRTFARFKPCEGPPEKKKAPVSDPTRAFDQELR